MWWWAEVSAAGTRSSGAVIFAMRARHSARRPHRTGASARRTRAVTPPAAAGYSRHTGDPRSIFSERYTEMITRYAFFAATGQVAHQERQESAGPGLA